MKTLFSILLTALALGAGFAQKGKSARPHVVVPPKVIIALTKNFPEATNVKWEMEKDDYEAEFKWQGKQLSALFHASGKLMETEVAIAVEELPKPVIAYVSKKYPKKKIDEAAKITKVDGSVSFEAEIAGKDLLFDASGNVLNTEK